MCCIHSCRYCNNIDGIRNIFHLTYLFVFFSVQFPAVVGLFTVKIFSCVFPIFNANYWRIKLLIFNWKKLCPNVMQVPLEVNYFLARHQHSERPILEDQVGLQCVSLTVNFNLNEVCIRLDKELSTPLQATTFVGWAHSPSPVCWTKQGVFVISSGQLAIDLAYLSNKLQVQLGHTYTLWLLQSWQVAHEREKAGKLPANPHLLRGRLKQKHLQHLKTLSI